MKTKGVKPAKPKKTAHDLPGAEVFQRFGMEINLRVSPSGFMSFGTYLHAILVLLQEKIPDYTSENFCRDIGCNDHLHLEKVMLENSPLKPESLENLLRLLKLDEKNHLYFLALCSYAKARSYKEREAALQNMLHLKASFLPSPLDGERLSYFSQWYLPVIGELVGLGRVRSAQDIVKHMIPAMDAEEIALSLKKLTDLGIIAYDKKNKVYRRTKKSLSTEDEVDGEVLNHFHKKMMELGMDSLESVPGEERNVSSLTVSLSKPKIAKLKALIQDFIQRVLLEEKACKNPENVCQLNIQFFPMTKAEPSVQPEHISEPEQNQNQKNLQ